MRVSSKRTGEIREDCIGIAGMNGARVSASWPGSRFEGGLCLIRIVSQRACGVGSRSSDHALDVKMRRGQLYRIRSFETIYEAEQDEGLA